jgi:hypothetical protein
MIIDRILAQVIDCRACALQNKTHKETCGNVTGAAIMCGICVIIVTIYEGELKIDRCSVETGEP